MLAQASGDELRNRLSFFEEGTIRILACPFAGNQILNEQFFDRHESRGPIKESLEFNQVIRPPGLCSCRIQEVLLYRRLQGNWKSQIEAVQFASIANAMSSWGRDLQAPC